jgi:hypothetical protein
MKTNLNCAKNLQYSLKKFEPAHLYKALHLDDLIFSTGTYTLILYSTGIWLPVTFHKQS